MILSSFEAKKRPGHAAEDLRVSHCPARFHLASFKE